MARCRVDSRSFQDIIRAPKRTNAQEGAAVPTTRQITARPSQLDISQPSDKSCERSTLSRRLVKRDEDDAAKENALLDSPPALLQRTVLGRSLVGSKKGTRATSASTMPSLGSSTLTRVPRLQCVRGMTARAMFDPTFGDQKALVT